MKRFCRGLAPLLLVLLAVRPARAASREVIDRILVRVNSRVITQSLLENRIEQAIRESGPPPDSARREELKKSLMEELVHEALLEDRARDLDLITTDAEVEEQIKRLKDQNNVATDEEFSHALAASGLTIERLREQLKKTLTVQRVVGREVNSKVDLSDDALRTVYEREKDTWRIPEQARLAEILISHGDDGGSRAAAERKAKEASEKLKAGTKFEEVVRDFSDGTTKSRGGDLGTVNKGDLNADIDRVVFSLPSGAVSDPIPTRSGWHLVKVIERFPVSYKPFGDAKAEILKKEQETQFQKKLAEYLDKLKRDAVIRVSAEAAPYYTAPLDVPAAAPAPATQKPEKKGKKS